MIDQPCQSLRTPSLERKPAFQTEASGVGGSVQHIFRVAFTAGTTNCKTGMFLGISLICNKTGVRSKEALNGFPTVDVKVATLDALGWF